MNIKISSVLSLIITLLLFAPSSSAQENSEIDLLKQEVDSLRVIEDSLKSELKNVQEKIDPLEQDIVAAKVIQRSNASIRLSVTTVRPVALFDDSGVRAEQIVRIPSDEELLYLGHENGRIHVYYDNQGGYISETAAELSPATKDYLAARERQEEARQAELVRWVDIVFADVYSGPGEDHDFRVQVEQGTKLKLLDEEDDWSKVEIIKHGGDGQTGWIDTSVISEEEVSRATMDEITAYIDERAEERSERAEERRQRREAITNNRRQEFVESNPEIDTIVKEAILNGQIAIGMTPDMVRASWGEPRDINRTITSSMVREQWVYGPRRNRSYVYIRNGQVSSIQN